MPGENIFALDIGTRSVVGVLMRETSRGLEIIASEHVEHQNRAMIDGQIHDIEQVAGAIRVVKERLEIKTGQPLKHVAVAAAGRALRTVRLKVSAEIPEFREIQRDDILCLELQAVQEAQGQLSGNNRTEEDKSLNYHCVGYSVVYYELDGYKIGNLSSQKGQKMSVEVIATFLPRVVVDSLFAALHKVDLEMVSLTLEPIAASAVVVPLSMRQLNIALVDIGAGTSDIALTDDGAITGYGMVPVAGDEITEKISQHYLVDFNQAEIIKKSLHNEQEIRFTDVLGIDHIVTGQSVLEDISESVQHLARQIGERIIELNGKTPQAIICIGGGSQTPMLKDMLAENLGLSKQRVAIRGREAITEVFGAQELVGPEAVTPIGIAVTSYEHKGLGFARVTVNSQQARLFEVNRGTVADALLAAGISMRKTQPRLGMALTVTVNGELKIIKGGRGKPAVIVLNGQEVTLDTPVKHNDVIEFTEARDGENARGHIFDVIPNSLPVNILINEKRLSINQIISMNGRPVTFNDELIDNARIVYYLPRTVTEVLELAGYDLEKEYYVYVNERLVDPMTEVNDGDEIVIETVSLTESGSEHETIHTNSVPGEQNDLPTTAVETETAISLAETEYAGIGNNSGSGGEWETVFQPEQSGSEKVTVVEVNGDRIEIPREDVILTDILTRINFPLRPPESGMRLELKVNGSPGEFTTPLKNGDSINLEWK